MPKTNIKTPVPYNIVNVNDTDAEINLYGEVVASHPVDWWTGEPVGGNFIALDEFLKDLDSISGKENITVHINSVGGDVYAGLAIYNRLKSLNANVVTINDGLAASAGSIIFQAGNPRKVNAGSNVMIHAVSSFLYGYYQSSDLRSAIKTNDSHTKAIINAYVEATGRDADEIKSMVEKETWMAGQEAIDAGFADELVGEGNPAVISLDKNRSTMMVNGIRVAARCFGKIPETIPVVDEPEKVYEDSMQPASQDDINNSGGMENMEIKNIDDLKAAYPDLVNQVEVNARNEAGTAERMRIQAIEDISLAIGDADMVKNAKYGENLINAEQLAFAAMKAQAAIGAKVLDSIKTDASNSGVEKVDPIPAAEEAAEDEDEQAKNILMKSIKNKKEDK